MNSTESSCCVVLSCGSDGSVRPRTAEFKTTRFITFLFSFCFLSGLLKLALELDKTVNYFSLFDFQSFFFALF